MDFIHYKEPLMILDAYMVAFGFLILQGFHIKQEEFNKAIITIELLCLFLFTFLQNGSHNTHFCLPQVCLLFLIIE